MLSVSDVPAWRDLKAQPLVGEPRCDVVTLDRLQRGEGLEPIVVRMARDGDSARSVALAPVHHANWVLMELLVRPLVRDGVWLAAAPHQLGLILDDDSEASTLWLDQDVVVTSEPESVGRSLGALLAPVVTTVSVSTHLDLRAVRLVAAESAIAGLFRAVREAGKSEESRDWLELTAADLAAALSAPVSSGRLNANPDDGGPVVYPARRLCCVLHASVSCHACPGCPKVGDRLGQQRQITEWLKSMSDDDFAEECGRPRRRDPRDEPTPERS